MTIEEIKLKEKEAFSNYVTLTFYYAFSKESTKRRKIMEKFLNLYGISIKEFTNMDSAFIIIFLCTPSPLLDQNREITPQTYINDYKAGKHKKIPEDVKEAIDFILNKHQEAEEARLTWQALNDKL